MLNFRKLTEHTITMDKTVSTTGASPHGVFHIDQAALLPEQIRFGTSSWTYPGWQGLIYQQSYKNEADLKRRSLEEYVRFPWFRTVGIDSAFYAPLTTATLRRYAEQVPQSFQWVAKVWEAITVPEFAPLKRYGDRAGKVNPDFLNADLFVERVLQPCSADDIKPHVGPFVFQFQSLPRCTSDSAARFVERLDDFLAQLPKEFQYATEVRNREILQPAYFAALNKHGATHCFNHWTAMPPLIDQMHAAADAGGINAPFYVARVLTPIGVRYEDAVKRFSPYDRLQAPIPQLRQDLIRLGLRAMKRNVRLFILVNNRAEGCAPVTIDQVGKEIVAAAGAAPVS